MATDGAAAGSGRLSGRRRAIGLAAGLLILAFLALGVAAGWDRVTSFDWQIEPAKAVAGFVVLLLMYLMSALGYVLILERLAHRARPAHALRGGVGALAARPLRPRQRAHGREPARAGAGGGDPAQGLARGQRLRAGALARRRGGVRLVLLAGYGAGKIGPAAWLVAIVPLGLSRARPAAVRPALDMGAAPGRARAARGAADRAASCSRCFAWYLVSVALLALGVGLLVSPAVAPTPLAALRRPSFLLSFVVSMLAFMFLPGSACARARRARAGRNLPAASRSRSPPPCGSCSRLSSWCRGAGSAGGTRALTAARSRPGHRPDEHRVELEQQAGRAHREPRLKARAAAS